MNQFPFTTDEQVLVSDAYGNKFIELRCSVTKNSSTSGVHQIRVFPLPEYGNTARFKNILLH